MLELKKVTFHLGEIEHTVTSEDVSPETTLNTYLRENLHLTGTKRMCLEGGCGSCVIAVEEIINGKRNIFSVTSCLVSILSCHGWKIHTIEGIGNPVIGYHPIQKLLADNNGTQCGICSTGMVMNMYALHESGPKTKKEIEDAFGGNLCRCTGYRPILTAFKKLASDADPKDIEDWKPCSTGDCNKKCPSNGCTRNNANFYYQFGDSKWIKVHYLKDLLETLKTTATDNYMLVAGNTARGVYRITSPPDLYIDISTVFELVKYTVNKDTVTLGANITLTNTIKILYEISQQKKQFTFLSKMADHINLIASLPIRNIGTLAGNLMIKYTHNEFPSDLFLLMETFKAVLVIVDVDGDEIQTTAKDFLSIDMKKRVLKNIILSSIDESSYKYATYKIMPRSQNAHAIVNSGFLLNINNNTVQSARIVYGGINPAFVHAKNTEQLLRGKKIFDNNVLLSAFQSLDHEIKPNYDPPNATPQYRKGLAIALFYKYVLKIAPSNLVSRRFVSGGTVLERPVSIGIQEFGTVKSKWPVTQPVIKVEALAQTSGQAEFIPDMPDLPDQLFAAFVTAKARANSTIIGIDAAEALKIDGVVAFFDKKDIPGENNFMPKLMGLFTVVEEIFCSGKVKYYDQPVGLIVAVNQELAVKAATMVNVAYSASNIKPFLNVKEVVQANATDRIHHLTTVVPKRTGDDIKHVIKGEFYLNWQYHFHMEVQCCNVVPIEDGIDIYPSSQWMDLAQLATAAALNLPTNKVNVKVRRIGGAYGAKVSRNSLISTAAAIAAYKLQKPVKLWMPFQTNMNVIGKRIPLYADYEVGVNDKGVLQYMKAMLYSDYGVGGNEVIDFLLLPVFENCYDISTWNFTTYYANTDTHANTWARAPGSSEGLALIENIMENIAYTLNLDPFDVKLANLDEKKYPKILEFWKDMQSWGEIAKRKQEIKAFNDANRWKKRGMGLVPMKWILSFDQNYSVLVSIFHGDGGVAISHGGIEMGQGINTKVRQVCAYKFNIPLDKVSIKPSYNFISANASYTVGSLTSEAVSYAVIKACDVLLQRMKPIRDKMGNPNWVDLVNKCYDSFIQLNATGFFEPDDLKTYYIYGLCAAEVEVDILTGQKEIMRVDIIEDVGDSMSPLIDIGQVEGAFVMGIGYHTTEEIIFNQDGQLLTNRTWNYKPPGAKDIPINFRIKFPDKEPNPVGVLQSKAVAEPPVCLSVAVPIAIRNAVASAREEADPNEPKWFPFDGPTTVENTFLNSLNTYKQYKL